MPGAVTDALKKYLQCHEIATVEKLWEMNSSKMNIGWLFFADSEIWAKCRKCAEWNKVNVRMDKFRPTPKEPHKMRCVKCNAIIAIDRVYFARKGMKKPKKDC